MIYLNQFQIMCKKQKSMQYFAKAIIFVAELNNFKNPQKKRRDGLYNQ